MFAEDQSQVLFNNAQRVSYVHLVWIMLRELAMCMALAEPCVNYAQRVGYVHGFSRALCQLRSED